MEKCKVCGREFKKITKSHLKTHGISVSAYDKIKEFTDSTSEKACYIKDYKTLTKIRLKFRIW